jgi:hypothetical protein
LSLRPGRAVQVFDSVRVRARLYGVNSSISIMASSFREHGG